MKHGMKKKAALLMVLWMMLDCLTGCNVYENLTRFDTASAEDGETDVSDAGSEEEDIVDTVTTSKFEDDVFTLNYNASASGGINPLTSTNRFNLLAGQLVYESLFTYDADFNAQPVLAESWSTTDGKSWTITIKQGVYFHDGKELTANDVYYSLRQSAKASGTYEGRFNTTFCIDITATGTYELSIRLGYADWDLPKLLDVPVIEYGAIDELHPAGTGPYVYTVNTNESTGEVTRTLEKFEQYRDYDSIPMDRVYLREYSDGNLSSAFSDGYIDLLVYDPEGAAPVSVQMDHEIRYYDTTTLMYLGFNYDNTLLKNAEIRRAIGHTINYDYICDTLLEGRVTASPLILSPAVDVYDEDWEVSLGAGYDLVSFSTSFSSYGMSDADNDGYLEYPSGGMKDFELSLLVNNDNSNKLAVAERIASSLRSVGVNCTVKSVSYSDYVALLKTGNFDMYLAETRLTADFNPSELLRTWGDMNWGGITEKADQEGSYLQLSRDFVGAQTVTTVKTTDENGNETIEEVTDLTARTQAALDLCTYVYNNAPIIPICYKRMAVISHRNVLYNLQPSQSSVFRNLCEVKYTAIG